MQTARKLNTQTNYSVNDSQHSARLEKILLAKTNPTKDKAMDMGHKDLPIKSRLEAENELEQALIKMFGYQ